MTASSTDPYPTLVHWCETLQKQLVAEPEALADAAHQLAVENAVAAGIAALAGEAEPTPNDEASTRPVLAKDLLMTADLVRRALLQYRD